MSNEALRAAYAAAMQEGGSPSNPPIPPSTETSAPEFNPPSAPGPSVSGGPNDLPVIGGVDFSKLELTPAQVARLHEQTVTLKAEAPAPAEGAGDDLSADNGEPTPIPVRREGERAPRRESRLEEAVPIGDDEGDAPVGPERMLLDLVTNDPELADIVMRKAREKAIGAPPTPAGPKRLTPEEFDELSPRQQREYEHQMNVQATAQILAPVLNDIRSQLRDIKQGESDRAIIAEKHGDFAALPKDHYLRATVDKIRAAQPGLSLVEAVEQAKELASFVREGAKRDIQAGQARVASTQVHKPMTAQTRELALDPRQMKAQGRSRGEILQELFQAEVRKRGVDV